MKLNRFLLTMGSLTILASYVPAGTVLSTTNTVFAQEETVSIDVEGLKEELSHYVPVNPEMLASIPDSDLIAYHNEAQTVDFGAAQTHIWEYIYNLIAENHQNGTFLTGDDLDAYFRVVEAIGTRTGHTLSELNKVGPAHLLQTYRQAMADNGDNVDQAVAAIQPTIETAIAEYNQRQAATTVPQESEPSVEGLKTDLIEKSPLTQDQLAQLSDETLAEYQKVAEGQEQPYIRVYNMIVEDYPQMFEEQIEEIVNQWHAEFGVSPEDVRNNVSNTNILWSDYVNHQSDSGAEYDLLKDLAEYGVTIPDNSSEEKTIPEEPETTQTPFTAETLRDYLIAYTPLTSTQFDQLDIDALLPFANQALANSETVAEDIYNNAYSTQTAVFTPEVNRIRQSLIDQHLVDANSLNTISDPQLLWVEYRIWQENNGNENFKQLAQYLIANYPVKPASQEPESTVETSAESSVQSNNFVESASNSSAESAQTELTPGASISNVSVESSEQSQHVTVTSSTDTEKDQESLPKTGEASNWWLIAIVVIIAAVSAYLIYTGRKSQHDDDELK